ncbi:hypothetical protein ANCCAN_01863 [Ancylostoma caninum]|uniref:SCP domain-containing protein n=1 Tax=Ancylostoma caninum TaxID=29170 RepID=A0A368HA11_ANCCA|nr:hypothetical protein ANCCAN_01863 [Ancylostoma caninum]
MWFKLIAILSVIALASAVPKCYNLEDEYTMQQNVKDQIVEKVLLYAPEKDIASISDYDCELEKMAGKILEDPYKPIQFLDSIGIYPLVYSIEDTPGENMRVITHAALDDWKKYLKTIHFYTFGCNYRKEHTTHKYLCLFRHQAE